MPHSFRYISAALIFFSQIALATSDEAGSFQRVQPLEGGSSLVLNFQNSGESLGWQTHFYGQTLLSNADSGFVMGYKNKSHAISWVAGQGEGSEFSGAANLGLEQNYFHGGSFETFNYQGLDWAYQFNNSAQLNAGHVQISARALEQRTADYFQLSKGRWSLGYTQVKRGAVNVGSKLGLSLELAGTLITAQQLDINAGGQFQELSMAWAGRLNDQFLLSLSNQSNDLIEGANDSRVMLSYQRRLGLKLNQTESQEKEKKDRISNGALIGAGAVAVALISSSGSNSQDNSSRFTQQHKAGRDALNAINPTSVKENREYGGYVYRTPDGRYATSKPVKGEVTSVSLPLSLVPAGAVPAASYHTHAGPDPQYDNEHFSFADIAGDQQFGIDGYLGTPGGQFLWHDHRKNRIVKLGTIAN